MGAARGLGSLRGCAAGRPRGSGHRHAGRAVHLPLTRAVPKQRPARAGLFSFQLGLFVEDVLARLGIVLLDLELVGRGALVLGRGVEVAGAGRRFELDLFAHGYLPLLLALISASTASTPSLSMRRSPAVETRRRTQRFWLSSQKRR